MVQYPHFRILEFPLMIGHPHVFIMHQNQKPRVSESLSVAPEQPEPELARAGYQQPV